jgi:hypothetical protein
MKNLIFEVNLNPKAFGYLQVPTGEQITWGA